MKIVADERVAGLDEAFGRHGTVLKLPGRDIRRSHLQDADALLVRTVTQVDASLLEGTAVRFVGTATIGFDHIDTRFLDAAGIAWTNAPGCNADATAQYTVSMYLLACRRLGRNALQGKYGVVGRGNVGGRLMRLVEALGLDTIACDPPLGSQGVPDLVSMDAILECDAISLHVPLTHSGHWPTIHMMNQEIFSALSTDALLINSSRGDVVNGEALGEWMAQGGTAALDVWPGEPDIDTNLLARSIVATPHVAGYSLDGKNRASAMVYRAFCAQFGYQGLESPPTVDSIKAQPQLRGAALADAILSATPVEKDDASMRGLLDVPYGDRGKFFESLRSGYMLRRDLQL